MRLTVLLLVSALLSVSGAARAASHMIEVDSKLADCTGVAPAKCMRVRESADQSWSLFYGPIEGFTFEPGCRYRLQVEEIPVAGGGALRFRELLD